MNHRSNVSLRAARLAAFGPGLMLAAAAIGVSHLVQATRAGADYGLNLLWLVALVHLAKYPFLEYGPRYAIATGESMLDGYWRLSRAALYVYLVFTVATMFTIQAALALVTARLAIELTGMPVSAFQAGAAVLGLSVLVLIGGGYGLLDRLVKIIVAALAAATIVALAAALWHGPVGDWAHAEPPALWSRTGLAFAIALMGWLPIPIDAAAWHSLWTLARSRQTGVVPSLAQARLDFNIGYLGTALLAVTFLLLGALVMYATGTSFSDNGAVFAKQLVGLYTQALGPWARPLIALCAFTAMFSTLLTVIDAHPRVCRHMAALIAKRPAWIENVGLYRVLLVGIPVCSLGVLYLLGQRFTLMIDLATTLSFLTAPVLAWLNYRLVTASHVPEAFRPGPWMRALSRAGLLFLSLFALLYGLWRLV